MITRVRTSIITDPKGRFDNALKNMIEMEVGDYTEKNAEHIE